MNALIETTQRWQFDRRLPLAQQVYADLRRRIISLDLLPDSPLSRVELSQYYQISQTPLREALQKLGEEGLVATYPQSRTEVSRIDVDQILEAQFLRKAVEADIVARLAADPQKAKLAAAQVSHDRLARSWEREQSFEEFAELDRQFHRDLYAAAGLASLIELIEKRCGQLDRIRRLHLQWYNDRKPEKVVSDHQSILDAILRSDVEGAQRAMREHLADTIGRIEVLRANYPDYFG
ncbi:MAG: GntR family transcriptional regulator [Hyphomicrobium sp.]|nr:GntR family transcriptional regulator [Hyphomicrobium sp.]